MTAVLAVSLLMLAACGGVGGLFRKTGGTNSNGSDTTQIQPPDESPDGGDEPTILSVSFGADSWATIAQVSASGNARDYYSIGDEKTITLSTDEEIVLQIWGFDHDNLSDGGSPAGGTGKAGITVGMKYTLTTAYPINSTNSRTGGWAAMSMRTETLSDIFETLPQDLQNSIKEVDKLGVTGSGAAVRATADKLFLFARVEVANTTVIGHANEGEQYEFWVGKAAADRIKRRGNSAGAATSWWTRTPDYSINDIWLAFNTSGSTAGVALVGTERRSVCFGFCI